LYNCRKIVQLQWTKHQIVRIARTLIFVAQQKSAVIKKQHSDKDEEICRHQPSSPATTSRCPVTYTVPSTFLSVVVARAMAVALAVAGGAVTKAVALAVGRAVSRVVLVVAVRGRWG
jgi:hypothetical protein